MIFVLLPSRKADVYANVKLACMRRDRPVMSQCLLTSTIMADDKIAAVAFKGKPFNSYMYLILLISGHANVL